MIRNYFQASNTKISLETIEGTISLIKKMVVGKRGSKRGASAFQMYDKSKIRIHKGLFSKVLLPEEEVVFRHIQDMELVRKTSAGSDLGLTDKKAYKIKASALKNCSSSDIRVRNPRCRYETVGDATSFFIANTNRINPKYCALQDGDFYYFTESFFDLCDKNQVEDSVSFL